jgi:hypothetical protein
MSENDEGGKGEGNKETSVWPRSDQMMDYDAILSTQRELTPENLKTAADLVDTAMKVLEGSKTDEKTGFKTAYVMTRKITGTNFLNKKVDTSQPRFYIMIRDLDADGNDLKTANKGYTWGLIVHFKKTGPNLEPISEQSISLPRDGDLAKDEHLWDLRDKKQDWDVIQELTTDLKQNLKLNKGGMYIDQQLFDKRVTYSKK